jgi:succinate dehydrogenase / fumarate reductase cytochrome b subunit
MSQVQRPLSPHLQVYKWQLPMVTSIVHRATGIALAFGTIFLVWWLLAAATGPDAFNLAQAFWFSWIGRLMLFGWTWSLFFHLCNGIRHLFWDAGYGYEIKTAYASGYAVIAASVVLTVIAWVAAYMVRG